MQNSKRDTDVKNKLLDYVGEGKGGMIWENSTETYILPYVKWMTSASLMMQGPKTALWQPAEIVEGLQDGGHTCIPMPNSYWYVAETITVS